MKANELMVGDFVTFRDCLEDDAIIKVEIRELHAYDNTILVSIDNDPTFDTIDLDDEVVGIPLTPKILEKNGWLSTDEPTVEFFGVGKWDRKDKRIEYVHELQHALRLCGIEKEIEL